MIQGALFILLSQVGKCQNQCPNTHNLFEFLISDEEGLFVHTLRPALDKTANGHSPIRISHYISKSDRFAGLDGSGPLGDEAVSPNHSLGPRVSISKPLSSTCYIPRDHIYMRKSSKLASIASGLARVKCLLSIGKLILHPLFGKSVAVVTTGVNQQNQALHSASSWAAFKC